MKKGWIWIVVIGLLCSAFAIYQRVRIEQADRTVQLVLDSRSLAEYAADKGIPLEALYAEVADLDAFDLAISEVKLWESVASRSTVVYPGFYLLFSSPEMEGTDPRKLYIADDTSGPIAGRLSPLGVPFFADDARLWEFQEEYPVDVNRRKEALREPTVSLWDEALYPDYSSLDLAQRFGMQVVARIQNPYVHTPESLKYAVDQWDGAGNLVIFEGKEVLGYPGNLKSAAELLGDTPWGFIEFANQYGEKDLARLTNYNLIRVHSITPGEMLKIDPQVAMERYLRAVRERGARVLYLRPFPKLGLEENLAWFAGLEQNLKDDGYRLGQAEPKPFFKSSFLIFLPVLLAVVICGIRLMLLLEFRETTSLFSGLFALVAVASVYLKGYTILARQITAFGAAVIFPTLAVGFVAKQIGEGKARLWQTMGTVLFYTAAGSMLLSAALCDLRFVIKIDQFLGVKLMHIIPPLLTLWISIRSISRGAFGAAGFKSNIRATLSSLWPPRLGHIIVLVLVLLAGFVDIGRTGHDWGLPVLELETKIRVFLEDLFVIRPRLKEIFIGHPALFLGLFIASSVLIRRLKWLLPLILTVGSIGVTSVLNTFSHAHTPFLVSVVRTGWGFAIGMLLGLVAFGLLRLIVRVENHG